MTCACLSPPEKTEPAAPAPLPPAGTAEEKACACKTKAPGSCSCAGAGKSCSHGPPPHPDGTLAPKGPDATVPERSAVGPPPVIAPRCSVIRCEPAHEDVRPPASFWDCAECAEMLSGTAAAIPWVAEPPQSADPRDEPTVPIVGAIPRGGTGGPVLRAEPVPEATAPVDTTAECTRGYTVVARYATTPVCRDGTKALPASDGSGLFTPLSPEYRGKGGGGAPACKCECHCPPVPDLGDLGGGVRFESTGWEPSRWWDDRRGGGPLGLYDPGPDGRGPGFDPQGPPLPGRPSPGRRPAPAVSAVSAAEAMVRAPVRVVTPRTIVVSPDAPAENMFDGPCPWCGGVRGEEVPLPRPSPPEEAEPPASVEPPQFAGPGPVRPSPPPGSLSFGTTLPRGPSLHPTAVADADVLLPGGAIALGARRQGPAGE